MTVISIDNRRHTYNLENCSGCHDPIKEEYREIGLPNNDNTQVNHIALCLECAGVAELEGVI